MLSLDVDHGHAKFLDGTNEYTPLQIVNNPEDNSSTVPGASSHHSHATSRMASQIAYISPELLLSSYSGGGGVMDSSVSPVSGGSTK
ncbi:hypothetical protein BU17DRAFT_100750 [Hysterangium stoloniferum]|nr:hypothetical protein BU17DRAFT_100750 [Hysterangium stoloniferum]